MRTTIIRFVLTPLGLTTVFYLGGVIGFLTYGMALPRIDEITIKGLVLGSLMWPVLLLYDVSDGITNIIYS